MQMASDRAREVKKEFAWEHIMFTQPRITPSISKVQKPNRRDLDWVCGCCSMLVRYRKLIDEPDSEIECCGGGKQVAWNWEPNLVCSTMNGFINRQIQNPNRLRTEEG
jgi:hypothetical protein